MIRDILVLCLFCHLLHKQVGLISLPAFVEVSASFLDFPDKGGSNSKTQKNVFKTTDSIGQFPPDIVLLSNQVSLAS